MGHFCLLKEQAICKDITKLPFLQMTGTGHPWGSAAKQGSWAGAHAENTSAAKANPCRYRLPVCTRKSHVFPLLHLSQQRHHAVTVTVSDKGPEGGQEGPCGPLPLLLKLDNFPPRSAGSAGGKRALEPLVEQRAGQAPYL